MSYGNAHASFTDDITIDALGRNGQAGFLRFKVHIDGNLSAALRAAGTEYPYDSYARAGFNVYKDGGTLIDGSTHQTLYANGTMEIQGEEFLNKESTIVVPIIFGTAFALKLFIQASTASYSEFGADCTTELDNTASWNGIASVTDSGGNPVANYTVSSGSGADYTQPITAPAPVSALSRKTHGAVAYNINLPVTGTPGVECRTGGPSGNHQAIISFANAISISGASVASGVGSVDSFSVNEAAVTVNLTGVGNAQRLVIKLSGVNDGATLGNTFVTMGVLLGDTTGTGTVNASDIGQTKSKSGQATGASNFRNDVTVTGSINSSDIGLVKSKSGTALPQP